MSETKGGRRGFGRLFLWEGALLRASKTTTTLLFLLPAACAGGAASPGLQPKASETPAPETGEAPELTLAGAGGALAKGTEGAPPTAGAVAPVESSPADSGVFPPPDPGPPFSRSAHPGDGVWTAFFEDGLEVQKDGRLKVQPPAEFNADLVRRMVIHPHEASRFQKLTLAAFDLKRLRLHHRPGQQDVRDMKMDALVERSGLVPKEERPDIFAVFNGGFQPRHGRWGMYSLDTQIIPPRDDACTVAALESGRVAIASWPRLRDGDQTWQAYRQSPPCLVEEGKVHPALQEGERRPWAGQNADRKTRRRSAVGVSQDGRTLFFAVGQETEPETLAQGLLHAGAHSAAQLDINWNWTRLFLFWPGKKDEVLSLGSLEENMAKDRGEYIVRPSGRGFFYLTRRKD